MRSCIHRVALVAWLVFLGLVLVPYSVRARGGGHRDRSLRSTDRMQRGALAPRAGVARAPGASATVSMADTTFLASYTFDAGGGCDAQEWSSRDNTAQLGDFFHVDDFSGLSGFGPLEGLQSLWCGVRPSGGWPWCGYASLPGYGNNWDQAFCTSACLTVNGDVEVSFRVTYDTEPGYDGMSVEVDACDDNWIPVGGGAPGGAITGTGVNVLHTDVIPSTSHGGMMRVRLHFVSDVGWSDEDGLYSSHGAVIVDSLVIRDAAGDVTALETFEDESPGATSATEWTSCTPPGFGDFAGLMQGGGVLQRDPCRSDISCLWGFFEGSTANYACGGYPQQAVVPFGNARGQYLDNQIESPWIPLVGTGSSIVLAFDVYRDLPLLNQVFYTWSVRSIVNGCPGEWRDLNVVYGGSDQVDWLRQTRFEIGNMIDAAATHVQVALGAVDMCPAFCAYEGFSGCHSNAPLFDNVNLFRIASAGPDWHVFGGMLFQDAFPDDGTTTGTAGANVSLDLVGIANSAVIRPGDSVVVEVSSLEGLAIDPAFGGEAVYGFARCTNPTRSGGVLVDDPTRWPVVGAPTINGQTWTQIRMDALGNALGPPMFCLDLNDTLFTPGDTTWFFFGARDGAGAWSYWTRMAGRTNSRTDAAGTAMEFTILPTGSSRILYVDGADGHGSQPDFDAAFSALGIQPDRYDIRFPELAAGNHPGSGLVGGGGDIPPAGVKDVVEQVISAYDVIIWSTGTMTAAPIGDGPNGLPEKSDDARLLLDFLNLSTPADGRKALYLCGDAIAEVWNGGSGLAGSGPALHGYISHALVSGNHAGQTGAMTPIVAGAAGGCFVHGGSEDSLVAYGACPVIRGFDEIAPSGGATLEMTYADNGAGAVVSQVSTNPSGNTVAVVLSGFDLAAIRDDVPGGISDRDHHLDDVLTCLGVAHSPATGVRPAGLANSLSQNYPNPFNPQTTIRFTLKDNAPVSLKIYNVSGQLVKTLVSGTRTAGEHTVRWDGRNDAGQAVSSGVYFYKLVTKNFSQTRKMVLLK